MLRCEREYAVITASFGELCQIQLQKGEECRQYTYTMPNSRLDTTRYQAFKGLKSPKEKMLVAKYGKIARPATDAKCTEEDELRASVFQYVLQTYAPGRLVKGIDAKLELYQCLIAALQKGDGNVFRYVADSVDAITHAHDYGWAYPHAVMLLSEYFPRPLKTKANLWDGWGEDMVRTPKELFAETGNTTTDTGNLRKLAVALGIDLNGGTPGRPSKKAGNRKL